MAVFTAVDYSQQYFQCVLYTGDGSSRTITLPDTDADTAPDLVWIKQRGGDGTSHTVFDSVRGVQEAIFTNNTNTETTRTDAVSAFNTDGFDLGSNGDLNANTETYVAWCWKANGSGSSNTAGSINTTATSANTTAGFSIVTWTGDENSSATLGHGLGAVPKMIITKGRTYASSWATYHNKITADYWLQMSETDGKADVATIWNDTEPTSTLFTVGSSNQVNDAFNYVAYVFTDVQGFSKFGSYTGNGNADGPFVPLTFRPAWILTKRVDSTGNWNLFDNRRTGGTQELTLGKANPMEMLLHPDLSNAEVDVSGGGHTMDGLANGFKIRSTSAISNASGGTYIYAAFADAPLVNSKGVPCCAM